MRVPLVDLSRQHEAIEDAVASGIAGVIAETAFIQGSAVAAFEREYADLCGVAHCIGLGSGTDAIELSIRALGLGPDDRVIVPANSFIASALAVIRAGVGVVLVDCDPNSYLIDVDAVADAMSGAVKAVMPVHLYGQVAEVERIQEAAGDVVILEDGAQSQGAMRADRRAGSLGLISATSFYPGKNLGAYGDAGAVLTDDDDLAERVRKLGNWGSAEKYYHPLVGFNSRLDTIQAVVLRAKLGHLDEWNAQRRVAAKRYDELLQSLEDVERPTVLDGNLHVWHLYVVRVSHRNAVVAYLHEKGVGAGIHYPIPMHLQGALSSLGHGPGDFPEAERASEEILSLPIFPGITEREQEYVVDNLSDALRSLHVAAR